MFGLGVTAPAAACALQVLFGPFGGLKIKVAPSKQGSGGGPLQRGYST